ncbi:MAG: ankyrin repeat domain-containing protein [Gemmatimonadaceae bacterium]|nr:ankyrin repeat domain-containing protein [Gemmatimonadaceae bacterium]
MLIKLVFWGLVALDTAGIGLLFVLGLAAAGSAKTNPLMVALYLLVLPGIPLVLSVLLFMKAGSPMTRGLAFLLVAAPLLILAGTKAYSDAQLAANMNEKGELTFFKAGPSREIAEAIRRNDAATVAALLPTVDVNASGLQETTLLIAALRQLRETPTQHDVLRLLLAAKADPNKGTAYELPLEMALQTAAKSGPAPARMLIEAGANPNTVNSSGTPVFFTAAGNGIAPEVMTMLIEHGADLSAKGNRGTGGVLFYAADARNWPVVLMLLQRGVDWRQGRTLSGQTFREMLEANASWASSDSGFAEVMAFVKKP